MCSNLSVHAGFTPTRSLSRFAIIIGINQNNSSNGRYPSTRYIACVGASQAAVARCVHTKELLIRTWMGTNFPDHASFTPTGCCSRPALVIIQSLVGINQNNYGKVTLGSLAHIVN